MNDLLKLTAVLLVLFVAGCGPQALPYMTYWPYLGVSALTGAGWAAIAFFFVAMLMQMAIDAYHLPTTGRFAVLLYAVLFVSALLAAATLWSVINVYAAVGFMLAFVGICAYLFYHDEEAQKGLAEFSTAGE